MQTPRTNAGHAQTSVRQHIRGKCVGQAVSAKSAQTSSGHVVSFLARGWLWLLYKSEAADDLTRCDFVCRRAVQDNNATLKFSATITLRRMNVYGC